MIHGFDARALDRYLTREPDWDEPVPVRCSGCGRFLKAEPDGIREVVAIRHCDGSPQIWDETHTDDVLSIIGSDHRGEVFQRAAAPHCGNKTASHECGGQYEISPDDAESYRHAPHFFVDDMIDYRADVRFCACGEISEEQR